MNLLLTPLEETYNLEELKSELRQKKNVINFCGLGMSAKVLIYGGLKDGFQKKIILCHDEIKAREFMDQARSFHIRPIYFPEKDMLFCESNVKNNIIEEERMAAIRELITSDEVTIVTTANALLSKLPSVSGISSRSIRLERESEYDFENLCALLYEAGYERTEVVEETGSFAVRGGIIDIYPLSEDNPVRIEFFGDEIESIRYFSPVSQRSIKEIDSISIYPVKTSDDMGSEEVSFIDYFDPDSSLVVMNDPMMLKSSMEEAVEELKESIRRRNGEEALKDFNSRIFTVEDIRKKLMDRSILSLNMTDSSYDDIRPSRNLTFKSESMISYEKSMETLVRDIIKYKKEGYRIVIGTSSSIRAQRIRNNLEEFDIYASYSEDGDMKPQSSQVVVTLCSLNNGLILSDMKWVMICEGDIFGASRRRKTPHKKYEGEKIAHFNDLKTGDFVVHENYGIGIYRGIKKIERGNVSGDYIAIEYAGKDKLYVPVNNFKQIQKYASSDAKMPRLNKLSDDSWSKTKTRVRKAVDEIAQDLVILYANRQETKGFVYGEDTIWQKEFEDSFTYEETDDQLQAIEDVKRDMESERIMDRLICGDVGYGKTEIAIRAAFKAVQENKQVAYLVPTTILAKQHYDTFLERFRDYPVDVELLCRFRSSAEQKKTVENLKKGKADIVIGTHRLLSKDVGYKDLGLLIIDEEQRFGVSHKEKIKKLKENIDVLTLSATPIPRTLHMSLLGIRSMSVLEEPPRDRMAIQTYVMDYDEETIREAVLRELNRKGQVYYVFNRVKGIAEMARKIALLCPGARVDYVHGQMNERELEDRMYDFINGDIDVLVSTTIIETGLDIPNVNTMLIHDADRLGLSQLYQLRGRVGRSNRSAYCFLLVKRNRIVSEEATKRLEAIREFTALGSGFKIAMKDLEIRGAGNMLGSVQSGHMSMVGYDLYCKMLSQAVKKLKGETEEEETIDTSIDIRFDAYIPDSYIKDESQKLDVYKDISMISSLKDRDDMEDMLEDRYGKVPLSVKKLMEISIMREEAKAKGILEINEKLREIQFIFRENANVDPMSIVRLVKLKKNRLRLINGKTPELIYLKDMSSHSPRVTVDVIKKVLNNIQLN